MLYHPSRVILFLRNNSIEQWSQASLSREERTIFDRCKQTQDTKSCNWSVGGEASCCLGLIEDYHATASLYLAIIGPILLTHAVTINLRQNDK